MEREKEKIERYSLAASTTASFLTAFMGSSINLAVPTIGRVFNAGALTMGWVVTSYILASAAFLVPIGRISDIMGRRKIFSMGLFVFSVSSFLCSLSHSIGVFIFFRVLQGLGSAMIFATSIAILTSVFPPWKRGRVLGINAAAVYLGLSAGPSLGGALNHYFGWESIFYIPAFMGSITAASTFLKFKGEWVGAKGENFDLTGAILYSAGLVLFMYGVTGITSSPWAKYLMLLGLVNLGFFLKFEQRADMPLFNLSLFKNPAFAFSNLAALINYSSTFAVGYLLSLYLQLVRGFSSQTAGLILLFQPVVMVIFSPIAGNLSDDIEPRKVASFGMAVTTLSIVLFYFIDKNTPLLMVEGGLVLLGLGLALFSSPNTIAIMSSVEKKYYGIASSTLSTMRLVGQSISMGLVTLVMTHFVGNVELSRVPHGMLLKSSKFCYLMFAFLCFVGIFASLARGDIYREEEEDE
ncbi:MAG: MFS transporter [Clostridia bacterium]|nr:MFS transporter [Clostridia bacterium]